MKFFQMHQPLSGIARMASPLYVPQQHAEFDQLPRRPRTQHAGRDDINPSVLLRTPFVRYRYQQQLLATRAPPGLAAVKLNQHHLVVVSPG